MSKTLLQRAKPLTIWGAILSAATLTATLISPLAAWAAPINPTFGPATTFPAGNGPSSVAVGDFNGDGKADTAVGNFSGDNLPISLGDGAGGFSLTSSPATGDGPSSVAVGDFNGDGRRDLAVTNYNDHTVTILLGNGDGTFTPATGSPHPAGGNNPAWVIVADFNGDGRQDLATANRGSATASVLLGDGAGGFGAATAYPTAVGALSVATADFNGDSKLDLAVANYDANVVSILIGDGLGGFSFLINLSGLASPYSVAAGDLNGDGKQDLAVANYNSNNVSVFIGDGLGGFAPVVNYPVHSNLTSVSLGDFNSDGFPDLALTNFSGNYRVSVLTNQGNGTFGSPLDLPLGASSNSWTAAVGDFNGDTKPDLVVTDNDTYQMSILLNTTPHPITFTSTPGTKCKVKKYCSFTITTAGGVPTPTISAIGLLPAWIKFHDNGDGTATLSGTPKKDTEGTYMLLFIASNGGVDPKVSQNFALTIKPHGDH